MKKIRIKYIERKFHHFVSLENSFRQIEKALDKDRFVASFQALAYLNNVFGIIRNLIFFRPDKNADIYHLTGHAHYIALLFEPTNTVLTIHDLRFLHEKTGLRRFLIKKIFLDLPVRRLKYITAISEKTREEIILNTNCHPDKIRVLEMPLFEHLSPVAETPFNPEKPRILQIGTMTNKNLPNLARALSGTDCTLVIVGRLDKEQVKALRDNSIEFENRFDLNNVEVRAEYERADLVTFCSTYEGFGLPIIEAQALRRPIVTSNLSPMKETAGGAASLVDPNDVASIKRGIQRIITEPQFRRDLVNKGIQNVERFRPRLVAAKYAALYEEIYRARGYSETASE